ncbi:hypothetical protein K2173_017515 [Erythroxylum novogranatense]|uniref:DUF1677 family protein n=1 Tax=Erythroxylum novogranatense TaxID=1862640 RepID=A0AAV8TKQ8_9ROSI|nr:hypothetical protein K2173_017515 [Erythroxylum novogranatense]
MAISTTDNQSNPSVKPQILEVESVKCHSCGFIEECTPAYISRVRGRYKGRWICGLCVEAVKYEVLRSDMLISTEEALNRHVSFCRKFKSSNTMKQTEYPIFVMSRILRRSLDSPAPRAIRTSSTSVLPDVDKIEGSLVRSESCFPSLSQ